jgi:hypothetical protein
MKPFTKIASIVMAVVALLHLLRFIVNWKLTINEFDVPLWVSILGFIIAMALSIGLWKESNKI